ncbi:MAG: dynamin family protein [Candidatus Cybelea sp.]
MEDALSRLADLARAIGDDTALDLAEELAGQLPRGELNLIVAGQFKRGKSTLVNALLGADVMPTGVLPITGIITAIRYGVEPAVSVRIRREGETRRIALAELPAYASERYNPGNALGVERVDVTWPSERIRGFALFDTPGVGSTLEHNTMTARKALPRADAAILVVGPDPPIGAEELQYAREVVASSERLFLVFNKSDIAGNALSELLDFTQRELANILMKNEVVEILPLSATLARDAQRHGLEDPAFARLIESLRRFLSDQGEETRERSLRRRALTILKRLEALLAMRNNVLNLPRAERERRKAMVEQALQSIGDRTRSLELMVDDDIRHLIDALKDDFDSWYGHEEATIYAQSRSLSSERSSRLRAARLEAFLADKARAWRENAVERANRELQANTAKYSRLVGELEVAALLAGCEALHVDVDALEPPHVEFAQAKLEMIASLQPTTGLELLLSFAIDLLPTPIRAALLVSRYERVLARELDALRGKLRYGLVRAVEPWRRSVLSTMSSAITGTRRAVLAAFSDLDSELHAPEDTELARVRTRQEQAAALCAQMEAERLAC